MSEIVVAADRHTPRNKRDVLACRCGAIVGKGERIFRLGDTEDPQSLLGAAAGLWVCATCADRLPWTNEAEAEMGVAWGDFVPSIPNELDLHAQVPSWFVKGLKHSEPMRLAYWLGHHRGRNDQ